MEEAGLIRVEAVAGAAYDGVGVPACARSGREALELIESTPVHVAVLDMQMPQLGGLQVVRMMREASHSGGRVQTPAAILLANDLNSHLLREALMAHVFSVLSKPVDLNLLLDALAAS